MERHQLNRDGTVEVVAPAKVNLFLHVTGRRPNGYHELESLFAFTRGGDRIKVEHSSELQLDVQGPFASQLTAAGGGGRNNLVCGAAIALALAVEREPDVKITLTKELPVASGIGGGSSDAAATLIALCELWELDISETRLAEIALMLGADVPACLHQHPLYVRGIGEEIYSRSLPKEYGIVLLNPMETVSTPAIFASFKNGRENSFDSLLGPLFEWPDADREFIEFLKNDARNALQSPAISERPSILDALNLLTGLENALHVAMSGSGATCYALFEAEEEAIKAVSLVRKQKPDWWCKADALVSR